MKCKYASALILLVAAALAVSYERGWLHNPPDFFKKNDPYVVVSKPDATPATFLFGDLVTVNLKIAVKRKFVDPKQVDLITNFEPWREVNSTRTQRNAGSVTFVEYSITLQCLESACLTLGGSKQFILPPATLTYVLRRGEVLKKATVAWPSINAASRITKEDFGALAFRKNLPELVPVSYRVNPSVLFLLLSAAAIILLACAAALTRVLIPRHKSVTPEVVAIVELLPSPLEVVEKAISGETIPEHRLRLALESLRQEAINAGKEDLARNAGRLAWAGWPELLPNTDEIRELAEAMRNFSEISKEA